MSPPTDPETGDERSSEYEWPWYCLACEVTIYHDGDYCRDCRSNEEFERPSRSHTSHGFVGWIRQESYSTFIPKITVIAGIELALTGLWLQSMIRGSFKLLLA